MKTHTVVLMLGVALMAWGGASINSRLGLTGWRVADVAIFAVGVLIIAQSYVVKLEARVQALEAELRTFRASASA